MLEIGVGLRQEAPGDRLGDVRGALIAGLLLGVVEVLVAGFISSGLKEAVAFLILVAVLWTRPSGLFGRSVVKRA